MNAQLEAATAKVRAAADALARAYNHEHELEDLRAAIKADAIKRVMLRDNLAATPAEKIVETDEQYFAHREKQRESIVARFRADAEYWAAKCEATQASLITPDVLLLEAENERMAAQIVELAKDIEDAVDANHTLLRQRNEAQQERNVAREIGDLSRRNLEAAAESIQKATNTIRQLTEDNNSLRRDLAEFEQRENLSLPVEGA